jgi:hypothetical protein
MDQIRILNLIAIRFKDFLPGQALYLLAILLSE